MALVDSVAMFDFVGGGVAAVALVYLLYTESIAVHYLRFFRTILIGLLVFAITGPIIGTVEPALIHADHAVAGLFVTIGWYGLLARETEAETRFEVSIGG